MAATGFFQSDGVRASHHASGVPITSNDTVTTDASLIVNQIADQSSALIIKVAIRNHSVQLFDVQVRSGDTP